MIFFFRMFRACPPVHTFCLKIKGYRKHRKHKIKNSFLSTCPHFWIMKYIPFFQNTQSSCPPVHTFSKYFKGYKKERKYEIERQLLVHMSLLSNNEIHGVDFFFRACPPVHTFCKKIMDTRRKENIKYRYSYLSTCPHFLQIFWTVQERKKTWKRKECI